MKRQIITLREEVDLMDMDEEVDHHLVEEIDLMDIDEKTD